MIKISQRIMGAVVLAASLLALLLAALTGQASREYARCQAEVTEQLVAAQNARASAATQDRDAVDQMIEDFAAAKSGADARAALDRYRSTRASADAERNRNPLPGSPSQRCD